MKRVKYSVQECKTILLKMQKNTSFHRLHLHFLEGNSILGIPLRNGEFQMCFLRYLFIYYLVLEGGLIKRNQRKISWGMLLDHHLIMIKARIITPCSNDGPLKMIKYAFYLTLKAFFVHKIFKLFS